MPPLLDAAL